MILGICSAPEVLEVMRIIKIVITIIKIAVPIILIIFGMITYIRAILDPDDNRITKANKTIVNMLIAAASIFLIPTIVETIFDIVEGNSNDIIDCFTNGNKMGVIDAYIEKIESSFSKTDYNKALRYINNVNDKKVNKEVQLKRLEKYKEYVDIVSEIDSLNKNNFISKSKSIESKIDSNTDPEIKNKISKIYEDAIKSKNLNMSNYPVSLDDSLYQNLKTLEDKSLEDLLKENGSSISELNDKILTGVRAAGVGSREATVYAAMTLIGTVAEYGYKIPYYWGGTYQEMGVNPKWGANVGASATSRGGNTYYYGGMDCSGFFNWAVSQGMQKTAVWYDDKPRIELSGNTTAVCKIGDALSCPGHIALIVGIDEANKRYIIAEENSGLSLSSIPFNGSRYYGDEQYFCESLSDKYTN